MVELNFDKMFSWAAETDKETVAQLGVYKGRPSITIFKARNILAKVPIDIFGRIVMLRMLKKVLAGGPDTNLSHPVQKYNFDDKKIVQMGTIVVGRDSKNLLYMGISAPGFQATKFPFRMSLVWSSSDNEVEKSELAVEAFIAVLTKDIVIAIGNTNEKPQAPGGGGGNRGGGSSGGRAAYSDGGDNIFG